MTTNPDYPDPLAPGWTNQKGYINVPDAPGLDSTADLMHPFLLIGA